MHIVFSLHAFLINELGSLYTIAYTFQFFYEVCFLTYMHCGSSPTATQTPNEHSLILMNMEQMSTEELNAKQKFNVLV